ncbi:hypothetical protein [Paenibacillus sp. MY03]|uniref:hypothetical protein n=1 Tax=Paenibacillus sp. MY03 TaxID=302980 RepID=UPI00117E74D4|nr:hypothetical protein [Paenibacillus sp. MY03]
MLEGLVLIKNAEYKYTLQEIVKMVYARVYENEHISDEVRKGLLKEIELYLHDAIQNYESYIAKNDVTPRSIKDLIIYIVVLVLGFISPFIVNKLISFEENQILFTLTLAISVVVTSMFSARLIKLLLLLIDSSKQQQSLYRPTSEKSLPRNNSNIDKSDSGLDDENDSTDEVTIYKLIQMNDQHIIEVFKQRFILEFLIQSISRHSLGDFNEKYPIGRAVSKLADKSVISSELADIILIVYRWSSRIVHAHDLHYNDSYYLDYINQMKSTSNELFDILQKYQDKETTLISFN